MRESAVQRKDAKSSEIPGVRCGIVKEVSLDFNLLIGAIQIICNTFLHCVNVNTANVIITYLMHVAIHWLNVIIWLMLIVSLGHKVITSNGAYLLTI